MKDVDIEVAWKLTKDLRNKDGLPKKEIQKMYKSLESIKLDHLKRVLTQSFFFTDSTKTRYDYTKIQLFNLLYCGGTEIQKAIYFFELITSGKKKAKIASNSKQLLKALEYLTHISCITICEAISSVMKDLKQFEDERLEKQFAELHELYATNQQILNEFAIHINELYVFPKFNEDDVDSIQQALNSDSNFDLLDQYDIKNFTSRMKSSNYIIIIPEDLRIKFTEFVYKNHVQALDDEYQGSILQSDGLFNNDFNSMRPSSDFEHG